MISVAAIAGCGGGSLSLTNTAPPASSSAPDASSPAADASSPAPAAPTVAPSPGTTLATIGDSSDDGLDSNTVSVISNVAGNGFTALNDLTGQSSGTDQSTLTTYDVAGNQLASLTPGSFTGDCGAADVQNSAGRLIITENVTTQAAQGINPQTYGLTMTAWNATTGAQVWTDTLQPNQDQQISCPSGGPGSDGIDGNLWNFVATFNGQWGVFEQPLQDSNGNDVFAAIDLATGQTYANPNLLGVLGNYVVTGSGGSDDNGPATLTLTTPGSWPTLGTVSGPSGQGTPALPGDLNSNSNVEQEFAFTGYAEQESNWGDGTETVATPDGGYLIVLFPDQSNDYLLRAYSLPGMQQVWSDSLGQQLGQYILAISETSVLIDNNGDLEAVSTKTGQQQWQTNIGSGADLCDLTSTQLLVSANDQLATLSASTGKQLSYQANNTAMGGCPSVVEPGLTGIGADTDSNGDMVVTQLLTP